MAADRDARQLDNAHRIGLLGVWRLESENDSNDGGVDELAPHEREKVYQIARRRLAMQVLYELDARMSSAEHTDSSPDAIVRHTLDHVDGLGPLDSQRVGDLVLAAWSARGRADADFAGLAPEWPIHRMAGVDRAILRLGHCEIARAQTPAAIVISECVELARAFSTDRSPAFVNALLDKIAKRHEHRATGKSE